MAKRKLRSKCLVCTQKGNNVIVKSVDILPHQKAGPYVPPPPYKWVYNEWKKVLRTIRKTFFHSVEMERFELSSKRGINLLSTCLSSPSIVGCKQDRSHPLEPYPLKFHLEPETYSKLSPILLHHLIGTLRSHSIRVMSRPRNFCRD